MKSTHVRAATLVLLIVLAAQIAAAQQPQQSQQARWGAVRQEQLGENHVKLIGDVEIAYGDAKLFADEAEYFMDTERVVATGNVVLSQGANTIAADRADFNIRTRLGTFYDASGSANIKPPRQTGGVGMQVPQSTEETDVYFFGEEIEKIGMRRYRISNGGFTTCVQPTPRWDLDVGTMILNIDDYTFMRNAVFKVKGVPLLYLPILYYPTKEEDRATGFLLPTYSSSTLRGQSVTNAFFWAIDRSQDATITHDWYSKTGNGFGAEYRYDRGGGADGVLRGYLLDEQEVTYLSSSGPTTLPERRSFDIRGTANQSLHRGFRLRADVNYPSDIVTMQTYYTGLEDATRNQRWITSNLAGSWGAYTLTANFDRRETFFNQADSIINGSLPRVALSRTQQPLFPGSPIYFSLNTEYIGILRETRRDGDVVGNDSNLVRMDVLPQVTFPFKRWQWFTVNSTLTWRDTFYSRSRIRPAAGAEQFVDDGVNRTYYTLSSRAVGPVFNRIWNTPGNAYAERFKHTVEPFLEIGRTSAIDVRDRIITTDGVDAVVGDTTNLSYGLVNRFYARRRVGQTAQAQEIANVSLQQTYYSQPGAAIFDPNYTSAFLGGRPTNFGPITLSANAMPAAAFSTNARLEIDSRYREVRSLSVTGTHNWRNIISTTAGWSRFNQIAESPDPVNPTRRTHTSTLTSDALSVSTNVRTSDNRYGTVYSLNYDFLRSFFVSQSVQAFYNAQCCGVAVHYVHNGYGNAQVFGLPNNRRFFVSFSLAGLGNFSPFSGGLSGVPR